MSRPVGGMPRGECDVCGETVALRKNGQPIAHGPYDDRCPGGIATDVRLKQTLWDRMTGRLPARSSVDARMRNAADVAAAARAAVHPSGDHLDDEQFLWEARRMTEPWLRGAP